MALTAESNTQAQSQRTRFLLSPSVYSLPILPKLCKRVCLVGLCNIYTSTREQDAAFADISRRKTSRQLRGVSRGRFRRRASGPKRVLKMNCNDLIGKKTEVHYALTMQKTTQESAKEDFSNSGQTGFLARHWTSAQAVSNITRAVLSVLAY